MVSREWVFSSSESRVILILNIKITRKLISEEYLKKSFGCLRCGYCHFHFFLPFRVLFSIGAWKFVVHSGLKGISPLIIFLPHSPSVSRLLLPLRL